MEEALQALQKVWAEWEAEWEEETAAKVAATDNDVLLWQSRKTLRAVLGHAKEGGSYRFLIYDRLGFGAYAYSILLNDGMAVSNWICDIHHPSLQDWWGMTRRFAKKASQRAYLRGRYRVQQETKKVLKWLDNLWVTVLVLVLLFVLPKEM